MLGCKVCTKRITSKKGVNCANCSNSFHSTCAAITDDHLKQIENGISEWKCPKCRRTSVNKSIISMTRLRTDSVSSATLDEDNSDNKIETSIGELMTEMKSIETSFTSINAKIAALQALTTTVNAHDKRIAKLEKDNQKMSTMIKTLTIQHDHAEQKWNANKLQVNDVPFNANENLHTIATTIAAKLNVTLSEGDICDVFRMGVFTRNVNNNGQLKASQSNVGDQSAGGASGSSTETNRGDLKTFNNPIILTFRSIGIRNIFLNNYRKTRKLYFDDENANQIYVNEYLTPSRRKLLSKAKLFAKSNNIKYVWTKNGNIYMKKEDGSKTTQINVLTDFASMCSDVVGPIELE